MVFKDENPSERLAECTDEGETRFRAEKERAIADCLVRHPVGSKAASFAGVELKNLLSDGIEDVDEDEEETQWLRALEVVPAGWKAAAARLKSTGLRFMDESLAARRRHASGGATGPNQTSRLLSVFQCRRHLSLISALSKSTIAMDLKLNQT